MTVGTIFGLNIYSIEVLIMLLNGVSQVRKKETPVGFYNLLDPSKKEEITDVSTWNKKHGMMWII